MRLACHIRINNRVLEMSTEADEEEVLELTRAPGQAALFACRIECGRAGCPGAVAG